VYPNSTSRWDIITHILTVLLSSLPVAAGFVGAYHILSNAVPSGFSCRHVWLVIVFGLWLASAVISSALFFWLRHNPSRRWKVTLVKDFVIGLGALLMITLSAMGAFNSCSCWGRTLFIGADAVEIPLKSDDQYKKFDKTTFPEVVGSVIFCQLVFCAIITIRNWPGITLMRWGETSRQMLWVQVQDETSQRATGIPLVPLPDQQQQREQRQQNNVRDVRAQAPGRAMEPGRYSELGTQRHDHRFYMIFWRQPPN